MDYRERWELKDYLFGRILERRILLFHVLLIVMLLGYLLNFWYLQGVQGETYAALSEENRMRRMPVKATRGVIVDRYGDIIATTRPSLDLMLSREGNRDLQSQMGRLTPIVGTPVEEMDAKLASMRGRPLFESLLVREDVGIEALSQIEARRERFPSVEIQQHARRYYPEVGLVAHAAGYVGQVTQGQLANQDDGALATGDIVGKAGVERTYDETLRGKRGWERVEVNSLGRKISAGKIEAEPAHGQPLTLTLDLAMQRTLVAALGDEMGAGVFLDPTTGDVLAIASSPAYDPNQFADGISVDEWKAITEDPRRPLHDRAIASYYAPGSTFKVMMAVAGLENGTVDPSFRVFCNGSAQFHGRRRLCWKRGGHGWVDLKRALAESCNIYFYTLGQKLTIDPITRVGEQFGLGRVSGVDIPGEEAGILASREWKRVNQKERWYPGDTISVAIGQGLLAVTPIQMARAMAAVANGGTMPRPRLWVDREIELTDVPISPATLRLVREAMAEAVKSGTAKRATRGEFTVAGKTGTAQVYKHSAGVDSDKLPKAERDHAWFVGYAPAENPTIAFAVVIEHGGHGGASAAPVVQQVLDVFFDRETVGPPPPSDRQAGARSRREQAIVRTTAAR